MRTEKVQPQISSTFSETFFSFLPHIIFHFLSYFWTVNSLEMTELLHLYGIWHNEVQTFRPNTSKEIYI